MNPSSLSHRERAASTRRTCSAATAEPLEPRTLLAFAELDDDGTLTLNGTDGADVVSFGREGDACVVTLNGQAATFPFLHVRRLDVALLGGDDRVNISGDAPGGVIDGGAGQDRVFVAGQNALDLLRVVADDPDDRLTIEQGAVASVVLETPRPAYGHVTFHGTDGSDLIVSSRTQIARDATRVTFTHPLSISIRAGAGNDTLLLAGSTRAEYQSYDGGGGWDLLQILGDDDGDLVRFGDFAEDVNFSFDGPGRERAFEQFVVNLGSGRNRLEVSRPMPSQVQYQRDGGGEDELLLVGQTWHLSELADALDVWAWDSTLHLPRHQALGALSLTRSELRLAPGRSHELSVRSLTIDGASRLDLADGALVIRTAAEQRQAVLEQVTALVASARNAQPQWAGFGIGSSVAAAAAATATATGPTGLAAVPAGAHDVIVKYTWNGDVNLDGRIDADDYFRIDSGLLHKTAQPAYADGDFNYDGTIDADDYFLIDSAFLEQAGPAAAQATRAPPANAMRSPHVSSADRLGARRGGRRAVRPVR